jgi:hypothetical protein
MFFGNDARAAQTRARLALWTLHGLMLVVLGLLLWRAFDLAWACGTLLFLALEPTVGAHLPVVMTDLPLALSLAIAALCAGLLATTHWPWAIGCGLAMGVALASKHRRWRAGRAGIGLVITALCGWRQRWSQNHATRGAAAVAALLSMLLLWSVLRPALPCRCRWPRRLRRPITAKIDELTLPHWQRARLRDSTGCCRAPVGPGRHRPPAWKAAASACTGLGQTYYSNRLVQLARRSCLQTTGIDGATAGRIAVLVRTPTAQRALEPWRRWLRLRSHDRVDGIGRHLGRRAHALPVLVGVGIVAGGALGIACKAFAPAAGGRAALCAGGSDDVREPRLWEYHNELVGGSANAYRYFGSKASTSASASTRSAPSTIA